MLMKFFAWGLALFCSAAVSFAAATRSFDKVQFQGGKVLTWPGANELLAPNEAALPFEVSVKTNGTFTVQGGSLRALREGESISKDGTLARPDGTVQPVVNHLTLTRGQVMLVQDGVSAPAREPVKISDGTIVYPDGKVAPPTGSPRRLLDGEVFQLKGGALPTRDTITLQGGRVKVQKDGSLLTVAAGRSIMMNDGTKVFGDGKVIKTDGTTLQLAEGQIIVLEGVVTRER